MKNIWHIAYNHSYDDIRILEKECRSLSEQKEYKVTYITSNKNCDIKEVPKNRYGVNIKIIPVRNGKRIKRLLKYISDIKREISKSDEKVEIVHIHEPGLWSLAAWAKARKIKVIIDEHEDPVNNFYMRMKNTHGRITAEIIKRILLVYQFIFLKKANAIITVTESAIGKIKYKCKINEIISNFPIIENNSKSERSFVDYKKYIGTVCFAGSVSHLWSHEEIMAALEEIPECKYLLAGRSDPGYLDILEKYSAWKNQTEFLGQIPHDEVYETIYEKAGMGIALVRKDSFVKELRDDGTLGNTKLFEFMQYGLPVICTDFNIWKKIVLGNQCGIPVNPENNQEIVDAIRYLIDNPEIAYKMGQRGKKAVENEYNWHNEEKKLLLIYRKLTELL